MGQQEKSALFQELKEAGVQFSKHYRNYTEQELADAVAKLRAGRAEAESAPLPAPAPATPNDGFGDEPSFDPTFGMNEEGLEGEIQDVAPAHDITSPNGQPEQQHVRAMAPGTVLQTMSGQYDLSNVPVRPADPNELPGQRQNTGNAEQPIRVDPETGHVWFQEEMRKPAYPKPRARRVVEYMDSGVKEQALVGRDFSERFEVAGDGQGVPAQVKVTLPSYQVGVFQDPRMPFKTHTYNGVQGFDFSEVCNFYGGSDMVPPSVKRMYVANVLCFDIRTTVRAIQDEYRERVLTGNIKEIQS